MSTTAQTTEEIRAEYIAGLRVLADVLEAHSELILPYAGSGDALLVLPHDDQLEQLAAWARVLPGRKEKQTRDGYFDLIDAFRGLRIQLICDRDEVCEKVVTGTREVTEEVRDPEALAAVPLVTVTKTVEDVEWICRPIMEDRGQESDVVQAMVAGLEVMAGDRS